MVDLYGIPNCDTVRKARKWLDASGVEHTFHDFRKEGVHPDRLRAWVAAAGWDKLLNRTGTTFRKLEPEQKEGLDAEKAIRLMEAQPSLIKRPVVEHGGGLLVGFREADWDGALR